MTFEVEVGGRRRVIGVEPVGGAGPAGGRFRVVLHDVGEEAGVSPAAAGEVRDLDVRPTDPGLSMIDCETGRIVDVALHDRGAGQWLLQFPRGRFIALVDGRLRASRTGPAASGTSQRVTAPMPGRIVRVLVAPDDEVRPGQGLVVVEAMKMENELTAVRAGRVREVTVTAGAAVEAGRLLVVIE